MRAFYFILLITSIFSLQKSEFGNYVYKTSHFSENLELKENNKFTYKLNLNFSQYEVQGDFHILNDSLILNSYPQKDRIIVSEDNIGKKQNITFEVKTKYGQYFTYDLHLILDNNEELTVKNQLKKSKFKNLKIKGFYIIDKNGLRSPKYMLKGTATNYFKIIFENSRVFENENWVIKDNIIIPRGLDGELQNYSLEKKSN